MGSSGERQRPTDGFCQAGRELVGSPPVSPSPVCGDGQGCGKVMGLEDGDEEPEAKRVRREVQEELNQDQAEEDEEFMRLFEDEVDEGEVEEPRQVEHELFGTPDPDEDPEEAQRPNQRVVPEAPSQAEVDEHELTHMPYRPWCRHCRAARGREDQHRRKTRDQKIEDDNASCSVWSVDYTYFSTNGQAIRHNDEEEIQRHLGLGTLCKALLASYARKTRTGYMNQCETKGVGEGYMVDRTIRDINEAGYGGVRLVLKSDQEFSIVDVAEQVGIDRPGETVPQVIPQGDSQSNGEITGWIGRCKGQIRTLKLSTESHFNWKIIPGHPIWEWMVEWGAQLINRYRVDDDGRTGVQIIRGKRCRKPICMFGEKVLWKPLYGSGREVPETDARFYDGIWLGLLAKSDEDIIGTSRGVIRARTIRRLPGDQRWDGDVAWSIRGIPRCPTPGRMTWRIPIRPGGPPGDGGDDGGDDGDDNDDGSGRRRGRQKGPSDDVEPNPPVEPSPVLERMQGSNTVPEPANRRVYRDELDRYGKTPGCDRCRRPDAGGSAHSPTFRARIWAALQEDARNGDAWAQGKVEVEQARQDREARRRGEVLREAASSSSGVNGSGEAVLPPPAPAGQGGAASDVAAGSGTATPRPPTEYSPTSPASTPTEVPAVSGRERSGGPHPDEPDNKYQQIEMLELDVASSGRDCPIVDALRIETDVLVRPDPAGSVVGWPPNTDEIGWSWHDYDKMFQDNHSVSKRCQFGMLDTGYHDDRPQDEDLLAVDVSEVYSQPRIAKEAPRFGLRPGSSLDVRTCDHDGLPWDFSEPMMRERARKNIRDEDPHVLIGSVMCTQFSQMMRVNWSRVTAEARERRMADARAHLAFVCELYHDQWKRNR